MPLPVSTALLVGALSLSNQSGIVIRILVWVMIGLALLNEILRSVITKTAAPAASRREYSIPGAPREIPNPLVPASYREDEDAF